MRPNVFHAEFEYDDNDPAGFRSGVARVGRRAGGQDLAVKLYEVPPGESLCPYHYEFEEEWLVVLAGSPLLRTPSGEERLEPGDVVCFPVGRDGAHKLANPGSENARVLMFSSSREPAVAIYPDSDKIGVWPGSGEDSVMFRRVDDGIGYYDGEGS